MLAREAPVDADVVVPVPDSGTTAAIGYAAESGIPFRQALIRNHYVGRTFIEPSQAIRDFGVKLKLNPVRHLLEGKRVILVDDSIVRGTTSRKIVRMVRNAGATRSAPAHFLPAHYFALLLRCGYAIEERTDRLVHIRSKRSAEFVDADTLAYLSLEALRVAVDDKKGEYCYACYTGDYPTELVQIAALDSKSRL